MGSGADGQYQRKNTDYVEMTIKVKKGYEPLVESFKDALEQAQAGKGDQRHNTDQKPLMEQLIISIPDSIGSGFRLGQVVKKALEIPQLPTVEAKQREICGIVNYALAENICLKRGNR